jgi:hypothetical protein
MKPIPQFMQEKLRLERVLLENMRAKSAELKQLLERVNDRWVYEDRMYRFYHGSFKVFDIQRYTAEITAALNGIAPEGRPFCEDFQEIIRAGTGRVFSYESNSRWIEETAPMTYAFLHARYFLEMAVKYGTLESPPQPMPSGWAAMLCLFEIR